MRILQELRPLWHKLYGFAADHKSWSEEQKKLADAVGDGLQQVAYFCQAGLIDPDFIAARNAVTFVRCWRKLKPFIEEYRALCGEPKTLSEGAFQRRHLEEFATMCAKYLQEHFPKHPVLSDNDL